MGNGIVGDAGAIFIKTRKFPLWLNDKSPTNITSLVVRGYAPAAKYYSPKYSESPETESYQKYAAIYWKPDIVIDSTGVNSFKFMVPDQIHKLNCRIEGISGDGTVYLEERSVVIKKE
jgi:hypothetical protein